MIAQLFRLNKYIPPPPKKNAVRMTAFIIYWGLIVYNCQFSCFIALLSVRLYSAALAGGGAPSRSDKYPI